MPYNKLFFTPGKISMIIHEPIDTSNLSDDNIYDMIENVKQIINQDL